MQKSELIKKAQHSDSITRDEFAIILAQHNKSMATTIEFQGYIFSAQEAGTIEPLHRSLEEHRIAGLKGQSVRAQFWNFKFKTIDLVNWAIKKGFNLPSELNLNESKELSSRSEKSYLRTIGALLEFIQGKTPRIKAHPDYVNDSKLMDVIDQQYEGYDGLSKSTLSRRFPKAIKTLAEE